jgi:hypothetical protein
MTARTRFSRLVAITGLAAVLVARPARAAVHVYVGAAPPPVVVEVRPRVPGTGYVWIGGFHRWDGRAYVWVPGRWALPPKHRTVWVPGHWKTHPRGWYWVEGHWR